MKPCICTIILGLFCINIASAQSITSVEGKCNKDVQWSFDGHTLYIERTSAQNVMTSIPDYDVKTNLAPWVKRKLPIKKVKIGFGFKRIGACAFANCTSLETVEFFNERMMVEIGWGAFLNCTNLFNISIPSSIKKIEKIAFANCSSLRSIKISSQTRVEDYAFMSCSNLNVLDIAPNVILGKAVFAIEIKDGSKISHRYFNGEIRSIPLNINIDNCQEFGLSKEATKRYLEKLSPASRTEIATSEIDTIIPVSSKTQYDTYALIIGNENYRFVSNVPFAKHDAQVFAEYCNKALGIPAENIHLCFDATKHMILEQEIDDWLVKGITDKGTKNLIIYYAGHGVPDIQDRNKSYLLPTDVYGTKPKSGIALNNFYATIGELGFKKTTIFMDACFSGINRDNEAVNEGLRGTEVVAEESELTGGNLVVFAAAQGNETAQGYLEQGHGLFTYYLLKEIQSSNGNISYGELARRIENDVKSTAPTLNLRKPQTPSIKVSDSMSEDWKDITL